MLQFLSTLSLVVFILSTSAGFIYLGWYLLTTSGKE